MRGVAASASTSLEVMRKPCSATTCVEPRLQRRHRRPAPGWRDRWRSTRATSRGVPAPCASAPSALARSATRFRLQEGVERRIGARSTPDRSCCRLRLARHRRRRASSATSASFSHTAGSLSTMRQRLPIGHHGAGGIGLRRGLVAGGDQIGIDRHLGGGGSVVGRSAAKRRAASIRSCAGNGNSAWRIGGGDLGRRRHARRGRMWRRQRRLGPGIALEEAPAGLLVEGEGAADAVVLAGRLAGLDRAVLDHRIIEPGQVGPRQQRDVPLRRLGP